MGRKTYPIKDLVAKANKAFRAEGGTVEGRRAIFGIVSAVLHDTGNYAGFNYLTARDLPAGVKPGIRHDNPQDKWFDDTDNTRVQLWLPRGFD